MTQYSMKKRRLCWMYVNHKRREYLSGNFLVVDDPSPLSPVAAPTLMSPESAVGASLIALLTPMAIKATGESIEHDLRGSWAGQKFEAINNKANREVYRKAESEYTCINLACFDYLRLNNAKWDVRLYETLKEYYELDPPRKKIIEG
jgi:hypothetical protein